MNIEFMDLLGIAAFVLGGFFGILKVLLNQTVKSIGRDIAQVSVMAHFAQIDENNIVQQVIVIADEDTADENGTEVESIGADFCTNLLGGTWVQTSYNANMRKNYAGIGFTYDSVRDAFIPEQPFPSWTLVEETCRWEPPVPYPDPTGVALYDWDENQQAWVEA